MRDERKKQMLDLLGRVIPTGVRCYYRPAATVCKELGSSPDELRNLIRTSIVCADFEITFERGDQLRFERIARPSTPAGVPSAAASASQAQAFKSGPDSTFDPNEVGTRAREYQIAEQKAGREVSATDAVAHVLHQATTERAPQEARGNPFAAETAARHAHSAAQLNEVIRRNENAKRS
jgi:hypothetical protein